MELTYIQNGDYMIPNLMPNREEREEPLTKYGILRRNYLREHREAEYTTMLFEGTLWTHLLTVQDQAEDRLDFLMDQMAKQEGVDWRMRNERQMEWVRRMNGIKARAEEVVLSELIYS